MPFIRRTRDKRGYENTYVMHAYRPAQGPHRTRILYIFRSPAGSKIGRDPLDGEVQEALEHTHPDLTFDWQALLRESSDAPPARGRAPGRGEPGERPPRPPVPQRPSQRPTLREQSSRAPAPEPAAVTPVVAADDHSLLGRTVGAEPAARLRARYGEILQRIARRSRSPEERDRLVERARRLNPDDWPDDESIRVAVVTVEAEWMAVVADLPARRRGRRGGRRRGQGRGLEPGDAQRQSESVGSSEPSEVEEGSSDIIEDEGSHELSAYERSNGADPPDDAAGDSGGVGSESAADGAAKEPASDVPGDD